MGQKMSDIQLSQEILPRWILSGTRPNVLQESNKIPKQKIYPVYNWSNETPCTVGENAGIAKWQITEVGEVVGICLWQNKASNLTYSVSMKKNADSEKLIALANAVYVTGETSMTYKMVSMAEGLEIAKNNPDAIIVDVRRDDEYKAGHIPGAVLLIMETITAETAAKVLPDKNQMILIYCRSGRRSKISAQNLLDLGYTNLIEFGGILDYKGKHIWNLIIELT